MAYLHKIFFISIHQQVFNLRNKFLCKNILAKNDGWKFLTDLFKVFSNRFVLFLSRRHIVAFFRWPMVQIVGQHKQFKRCHGCCFVRRRWLSDMFYNCSFVRSVAFKLFTKVCCCLEFGELRMRRLFYFLVSSFDSFFNLILIRSAILFFLIRRSVK